MEEIHNKSLEFRKLSYMEFWFMNWLMFEKEINSEKYNLLTDEELSDLEQEFIEMYKNIK